MTFKESLVDDWSVFINLDEFADEITYNDLTLPAVVTEASEESGAEYSMRKQINAGRHVNLREEKIALYVRTADLNKLPRSNDYIHLNKIRYKVERAVEQAGITKIICSAELDKGVLPRPVYGD